MRGRQVVSLPTLPSLASILSRSSKAHENLRMGICVSGGPDSMALAYLLQQSMLRGPKFELTGLIVDHKARPESTTEAEQVRENLSRIGIRSKILTMHWPSGTDPLQLSDFESQARAKRYRLLASEALRQDIHHLFLGHHQDDQVETILMRLIRNKRHTLKGLAGIASSAPVPECEDLFGVHVQHQGIPVAPLFAPSSKSFGASSSLSGSSTKRKYQMALPGGITLHRPLLLFNKQDLVTLCESNSVPYVIDPTNKDPRASLRNAVRHLRTKYTLPRALGRARILKLQKTAQTYLNSIKIAGEKFLERCDILSLDIRAGVLTARIPRESSRDSIHDDACTYAISKLIETVDPKPRTDTDTAITPFVISQLCLKREDQEQKGPQTVPVMSFSQGKVQFDAHPTRPNVWMLSRQPMRLSEIEDNTQQFSISDRPSRAATLSNRMKCQTEFLLWDHRFWIRIFFDDAKILEDIEIRPYHKDDALAVRQSSEKDPRGDLHTLLKKVAPGKVRFTLPVLTYQSKLIAFPTLYRRLEDVATALRLTGLSWEVRYNSFSLLRTWMPNEARQTSIDE